jgi:hypothetical protein
MGRKTSEFWVMSIVTIMFFLYAFVKDQPLVLIGAIVLPGIYIYSRSNVKSSATISEANKATAELEKAKIESDISNNIRKIDHLTVRK